MMGKTPDERYARPAEVASALGVHASGPSRLAHVVSTRKGSRAGATATLEVAFPAEWFDSDSKVDIDGGPCPTGSTATADSQEVFHRVDIEPGFPLTGSDPSGFAPGDWGWGSRVWWAAAVALFLLAAILAIILPSLG
jgi:hypothetical protein